MTITEMTNALKSSGYLLENRILNKLTERYCYIQSNIMYKDPITSISREIDMLVDTNSSYSFKGKRNIFACSYLVMEIIDNKYPIAFFKNKSYSPDDPYFDDKVRIVTTPKNKQNEYEVLENICIVDFYHSSRVNSSTQYCSFIEKKNKSKNKDDIDNSEKWMAYHPDELNEVFKKLMHFIDKETEERQKYFDQDNLNSDGKIDEDYRCFFFQPVLLIKDDLYEIDILENDINISKSEYLTFNYSLHYKDKPSFLSIDIITEKYLYDYLDIINDDCRSVVERLKKELAKHL